MSKNGNQVYFCPLITLLFFFEHCWALKLGTSSEHGSMLHVLYLALSPMQNDPPWTGVGWSHSLVCIETPAPHDLEQGPQSDQLPQPPSTGAGSSSMSTHFWSWHHYEQDVKNQSKFCVKIHLLCDEHSACLARLVWAMLCMFHSTSTIVVNIFHQAVSTPLSFHRLRWTEGDIVDPRCTLLQLGAQDTDTLPRVMVRLPNTFRVLDYETKYYFDLFGYLDLFNLL